MSELTTYIFIIVQVVCENIFRSISFSIIVSFCDYSAIDTYYICGASWLINHSWKYIFTVIYCKIVAFFNYIICSEVWCKYSMSCACNPYFINVWSAIRIFKFSISYMNLIMNIYTFSCFLWSFFFFRSHF